MKNFQRKNNPKLQRILATETLKNRQKQVTLYFSGTKKKEKEKKN